ncbi:Hypothetical predicted protein [Mytilus galloprovincialis]|uniref:C1q domain-containing protein n=1 Tax=Mytilus galloprovincialis TaxID=29158 RepID=A0A8B6DHL2_MYTGA|nr:Hypothetical predicted protein [Mytilus galloprovincialis]
MLMMLSVYLVLLLSAFLLEPNNQQNSTGGQLVSDNHYLTLAKFIESQKQQHRDLEALRNSMDDTISVLTSQLQKKFIDLEVKLRENYKQNETCWTFDELEKKILELENNYTNVLNDLKIANDKNVKMTIEITSLKNKTQYIDARIGFVEQLKNIQPLKDLQSMKQQIQTIDSQTAKLNQNQFARNQDFLALYNLTTVRFVNAELRIQTLENFKNFSNFNTKSLQEDLLALYNQTSVHFVKTENRLQHIDNFENVLLNNTRIIEDRVKNLEAYKTVALNNTNRLNTKSETLQTQISNNNRKVAVSACEAVDQSKKSGYIVKFDNVKASIGITDISLFTSSGKFKCENEGLYIVSVSLTTYNTGIHYGIVLNGKLYTQIKEYNNGVNYQGATTTVIVNLHPNDLLWVQITADMYVSGIYSCITIVMI